MVNMQLKSVNYNYKDSAANKLSKLYRKKKKESEKLEPKLMYSQAPKESRTCYRAEGGPE